MEHINGSIPLIGFTLMQGATLVAGDAGGQSGGGVYCWNTTGPAISNCVISGNAANGNGGGAFYGTLRNCTVTGNYSGQGGGARSSYRYDCTVSSNRVKSAARGGGAYSGYLENCTVTGNSATEGGGVYDATVTNCTVTGNIAVNDGGGAYAGVLYNSMIISNTANRGGGVVNGLLYNCVLIGNSAVSYAGGAMGGTLNNCTVVDNSSDGHTGGAWYSKLNNSVLYFNTAPSAPNFHPSDSTITFTNSCTTPAKAGWAAGNITDNPMFVGTGNYRLNARSPCVDAGFHAGWMDDFVDLDGNARILGAAVDMGAYEFVPSGLTFFIH